MGSITYQKMSLFDAPEGSILVHSCNAQGVWGSGIAAPFKEKYPRSWNAYNLYCINALIESKGGAIGTCLVPGRENKRYVGCLITSFSYGSNRDSVDDIIAQTYLALNDFCTEGLDFDKTPVYSNKFNSGMFKVPWTETERVLRYFVKRYNINWVVCDPDL
jgi:ADP-ribose 1''-phosphate phosphatase